jgi:hypothetical protein
MHFLGMLVVTQLINSILMCRFEGSPAYSLMRCHPVKRPNSALPLHDKFSYKKRENKDPIGPRTRFLFCIPFVVLDQ